MPRRTNTQVTLKEYRLFGEISGDLLLKFYDGRLRELFHFAAFIDEAAYQRLVARFREKVAVSDEVETRAPGGGVTFSAVLGGSTQLRITSTPPLASNGPGSATVELLDLMLLEELKSSL